MTDSDKIVYEALKEKRAKNRAEMARLKDENTQLEKVMWEMIQKNSSLINSTEPITTPSLNKTTQQTIMVATPLIEPTLFRSVYNTKKNILSIFDALKRPLRMAEIQDEYTKDKELGKFHVRETVRSLHAQGLLKLMKLNGSNKEAYWVKTEWIDSETNKLKPDMDGGLYLMYGKDDFRFVDSNR